MVYPSTYLGVIYLLSVVVLWVEILNIVVRFSLM